MNRYSMFGSDTCYIPWDSVLYGVIDLLHLDFGLGAAISMSSIQIESHGKYYLFLGETV